MILTFFERRTIKEIARERLEEASIIRLFLRQIISEAGLFLRRNVNFRKRKNVQAVQAYCQMAISEFEGINARQKWANWRTIPKNLNHQLPYHPIRAIDLCCGIGDSTEVLACYLPRGSEILGLEYNPKFIEVAQKRDYRHRTGVHTEVFFRAQSVLETFREKDGSEIADKSIDLVNSCGAVGSHFDREATEVLTQEIARVLKVGGLATIDSGAPGTRKRQLIRIFRAHGFEVMRSAKSHPLDLFTQVCFRKL